MISNLIDELLTRVEQETGGLNKSRLKALLESRLAKLDLVSRAEFEAQQAVLARTRQKLDELEQTLSELDKQLK